MTNRLVSVGDDFTVPAALKVTDANLPVASNAAAVAGKLDASQKGAANGIAPLGADSKVPDANIPDGLVRYAPAPTGSDDTAALTTAITNCPTGGKLILRPGFTYSASSLTLNKTMILDATGATINQPVTTSAKTLLTVSGAKAEVWGGTWDGAWSSQAQQNNGIGVTGDDVRIYRTRVQNFPFYGIHAIGARPLIDQDYVSNTGYIGIFAETNGTTLSGGRIANCTVDRSMLPASTIVEGGIKVHGHSDTDRYNNFQIIAPVVFMPMTPTDDSSLPVEIMWSYNSTITDAITTGGTLGISFAGCYNCFASGRTISPSQYGAELSTSADCTIQVTVVGNGVTAKGIDVNGSTSARNALVGCHVSGTTGIGIHLENGVSGTQVVGGSVNMTVAQNAIQVAGTYSGTTITGVRLLGNSVGTKAVMLDNSWGASVTGCSISNFTQNAVMIYGTTAITQSDVLVTGNNITGTPNGALASQLSGGAVLGAGVKAMANSGATDFLNFGKDQRLITGLTGSPEGVYSGSSGSLFIRTDGGQGRTLYVKETGVSTSGWTAPGSKMPVATKTANYTALVADVGAVFVMNGTSLTFTLPDPATIATGLYFVKNVNTSSVTVATAAGTIDGLSTATLAQFATGRYISDGSVWRAI